VAECLRYACTGAALATKESRPFPANLLPPGRSSRPGARTRVEMKGVPDTSCRIELLGGLRVRRGDRVVTQFETRKTAALLAYLAYFPGRSHLREALAEVVWPEEDPEATRARLRQSLGTLRRVLGSAASASERESGTAVPSIVIADRV